MLALLINGVKGGKMLWEISKYFLPRKRLFTLYRVKAEADEKGRRPIRLVVTT
jgi:hypothetical protein